MPATVCPHCGVEVDLDAADAGEPVECPGCHDTFTAPLQIARRARRPSRSTKLVDAPPKESTTRARRECRASAFGLFVAAGLTVLGSWALLVGARFDPLLMSIFAIYNAMAVAVMVFGGVQMMRLRQYGMCVAACLVAFTPFTNACFPVSIGAGVFGLITLLSPWVRRGFAANRPDFDPDQN